MNASHLTWTETQWSEARDKHMVIEEYPETHGDYRYLWRKRDLNIGGKVDRGEAVFLMRNPATEEEEGEEEKDRRKGRHTTRNICRNIAERLGYTAFTEINLFALRATSGYANLTRGPFGMS